MNLVSVFSSNQTIDTIALLGLINAARAEHKEPIIKNNKFIAKVEDELDDISTNEKKSTVLNRNHQAYYVLTIEQAILVGMRESKSVRRAVLDVLKEMANPVPQTYIGALKALVAAEEAKEAALQLANQAIATKAEIGHRREATAMNTASQAVKQVNKLEIELDKSKEWATIKRMEILHPTMKFNWRKLQSVSNALELDIQTVPDANYFEVKSYHAKAWLEAYGIEI